MTKPKTKTEPSIQPYVPTRWNRLVLVGEAPGKDEIRVGRPFVGASGRVLRGLLRKAEINPLRCYMTNVFMTRPPDNAVKTYFVDSKFGGQLLPERKPQLVRLFQELHGLPDGYKVILALGRVAGWALLGANGATNMHLNKVTLAGSGLVIRLHHPRYLSYHVNDPIEQQFIDSLRFAALLVSRLAYA